MLIIYSNIDNIEIARKNAFEIAVVVDKTLYLFSIYKFRNITKVSILKRKIKNIYYFLLFSNKVNTILLTIIRYF